MTTREIKNEIAWIDRYFANLLWQGQEAPLLVCFLLAMTRLGHLCVRKKGDKIFPYPSLLWGEGKTARSYEIEMLQQWEYFADGKEVPVFFQFEGDCFYLAKNKAIENRFLSHMCRLMKYEPFQKVHYKRESNVLYDAQHVAIQRAFSHPISVITGGPGTGKSFVAIELIRSFIRQAKTDAIIRVAAPTGKAIALLEKRLEGCVDTKILCCTVHSLLGIGMHGRKKDKTIYADLLLIDEASMLDASLFVEILERVAGGGRIVFMGDREQLPPVELGGFFADMIDRAEEVDVPVTHLQKSLRMQSNSVWDLAQAVAREDVSYLISHPCVTIFSSLQNQGAMEEIRRMSNELFLPWTYEEDPAKVLSSMERLRILSALRKGSMGVEEINRQIVRILSSGRSMQEKMACPIMITQNDRTRSFVNGDVGVLYAEMSSWLKGVFSKEDKAYFFRSGEVIVECAAHVLPSFEIAYCSSIHKSQGSEYEESRIFLPRGSDKFGKEVLYTAITRAKKGTKIFTEHGVLEKILQNSSRRISGLTKL